jgi:hypothetical protein
MVASMVLAQLGPLTNALETGAAAVGAGVVLGSVGMGTFGLARRWTREKIERRALVDGYFGGALGALAALLDVLTRYIPK